MKVLKRVNSSFAAAVLALSTLMSLSIGGVASAAVDTCTWTGATNGNFSDGTNWTGCDNAGVPENGDSLVFDVSSLAHDPINDMSTMSFANITFTGSASSPINITGNAFTVTGNITDTTGQNNSIGNDIVFSGASVITVASGGALIVSGDVSGSGSLAKEGDGSFNLQGGFTLSGAVADNAGQMTMVASTPDASFSSLTLGANANFYYDVFTSSGATTSFTMTKPVTTNGGTLYFTQATTIGANHDINLTGAYTLNANAFINAASGNTVHVQGPLNGAGYVLGATGSGTVINESNNNTSATPSGTLPVTAGAQGAGNPAAAVQAPGTPNTGFAVIAAHPVITLTSTVAAAGVLLTIARISRKPAVARVRAHKR